MPPFKEVNRYLEVGLAFPACIVVGLLLGHWLDRLFHRDIFNLLGLLLGIAAGFVNLIRLTSKPK